MENKYVVHKMIDDEDRFLSFDPLGPFWGKEMFLASSFKSLQEADTALERIQNFLKTQNADLVLVNFKLKKVKSYG